MLYRVETQGGQYLGGPGGAKIALQLLTLPTEMGERRPGGESHHSISALLALGLQASEAPRVSAAGYLRALDAHERGDFTSAALG
ncbi:hypothetical protein P7K49_007355 [Saguinus oedipus]|uniref:Uncharacterized protein n=1 Tax=Saguinus oedipus TaxID=9490 RepID=A0ABQ9VUM8_SAGOE|nr:hypothetical protein P7K49_007355 [Saguinus oedipus]